jgi:hypothetical protein
VQRESDFDVRMGKRDRALAHRLQSGITGVEKHCSVTIAVWKSGIGRTHVA